MPPSLRHSVDSGRLRSIDFCHRLLGTSEGEAHDKLQALVDKMQALCRPRQTKYPNWGFTRQEVNELLEAARDAHSAFGGTAADTIPSDVDSPRPFEGEALLRAVEATAEMLNVSEHVETRLCDCAPCSAMHE